MTNTKILSVFVIVAVAAMMGVSAIAPAYAERVTKDVNERDETHSEFPFSGELCGITSDFTVEQWTTTFAMIWSNGQFKAHIDQLSIVTDDNDGDALVLTIQIAQNNQGNFGAGEVQSIQLNEEWLCADGTVFSSDHNGATLHRDGTITLHHQFIV